MTVIDHGIFNLVISNGRACMDFNPQGDRYPQDLITSSFERERKYLLQVVKYDWAPELLEINPHTRQIVFKWYDNTCEDSVPDDYVEQLEKITRDLHAEQIYKPSFYTKYFYTDTVGHLHAYAFYSSSSYSEQPISMEFYEPILNPQRKVLVEQLQTDGKLDMGILVKHAFMNYIKWPGDPLPSLYSRVYGQILDTSAV